MQLGDHISKWVSVGELKGLFLPHFEIRRTATIMPAGHLGFLRFVNSYKVQRIASRLGIDGGLKRMKEGLGLGQTIVMLARRK